MKRVGLSCFLLIALLIALALSTSAPAQAGDSGCYAHRPKYIEGVFEVRYDAGCTGHDEPELDPVSHAPGSARELTWKVVLPSGGAFPVSATGPTFWFGGTVTDAKSLFGQAFVELQFYPDAIVTSCGQDGGFEVKFAPNTYSVCSPVWRLTSTGQKGVFHENAAFNAMLTDGSGPNNPLIMHAGDTITVHWFTTPAQDGFHVTVTDLTTNGSGTIVLNSSNSGPSCLRSTPRPSATLWHGAACSTRQTRLCGRSDTNPSSRVKELFASLGRRAASLMMPLHGLALLRFKFCPSLSATARKQKNGRQSATWAGRLRSWQPAPFMAVPTVYIRGIRWARLASTSAWISRIPSMTSDRRTNTSRRRSAEVPSA